ncbi:MAG: glycine/betaine ABC transporter substrate-binding protein [Candidatus Eremiobacteraeota bacterium]|nr:glycine/betaine ABC transporter substrate-binding protein [Candidatus Eremiobacteraeota bacterium]
MSLTRGNLLALLGASLLLPNCSQKNSGGIRIGSKNFTESFVVAEIYAQTLEGAGITVERKFNLGSVQIAMTALTRGEIDFYPEYTGTALIDVLKLPQLRNAKQIYDTVKRDYQSRYHLTWLAPSPMNNSQALATTQTISKKYNLTTLSQCARLAPQLRLAAIPEFVARADALPGLQKFYGGFAFKNVRTYDIGLKYKALLDGDADVCTAFTTDGQIGVSNLVVLKDDRHFWPAYNVAPVITDGALRKYPQITSLLNRVTALITDESARKLNYEVDGQHQEVADVVSAFLKGSPK